MAMGPEAWRKAARGDASDLPPVAGEDRRAFAHRRLALRREADAQPRRPLIQRRANPRESGITARIAPSFADRKSQSGFDRIGGRVNVVPVKAEARLKAQRVARAEANRRDIGMIEQAQREAFRDDRGSEISKPSSPV